VRSNADWLRDLGSGGSAREQALADLRALLVRGLSHAVASWRKGSGREFHDLLEDFVQEALIKVLQNLESFQGRSAFTTWAHKIAVRQALTELRRVRWKDVSMESIMEGPMVRMMVGGGTADPVSRAQERTALELLRTMMAEELSDKQRQALAAVALGGMPLEEAARRMGTNRNALYKLIHDARVRLKRRLAAEGMSPRDIMTGTGSG
jgi:RNA polymerase sigma-70 factor (ECF subfamily)